MTGRSSLRIGSASIDNLLAWCEGVQPLRAHWAAWMKQCMSHPEWLVDRVSQFGSPLHLHSTANMLANGRDLDQTARQRGIELGMYFARKANKCLCYVDTANKAGWGIDTASTRELSQCLERGLEGNRLVYTAAIKETSAIDLAIRSGCTIVLDNRDEWELVRSRLAVASLSGPPCQLALRLRGFRFATGTHRSRFGLDVPEAAELIHQTTGVFGRVIPAHWVGVHFHLDGHDAGERVSAISECVAFVKSLRTIGPPLQFIDMGGGFPVSYLEHEQEWKAFAEATRSQSRGELDNRITPPGFDFPSDSHDGRTRFIHHNYPYWQPLSASQWLANILDAPLAGGFSVAQTLCREGLQLRCEPGRSLVNQCGMTVARVCFRKRDSEGNLLVGLAMNRTQCRTTSIDFSVDPALLATGTGDRTPASEGYFVGAYCMEGEYITLRKMRFPSGVAVGDLVVFPNTAGYMMHFMESRSHQFALPNNVVLGDEAQSPPHVTLDAIDDPSSLRPSPPVTFESEVD